MVVTTDTTDRAQVVRSLIQLRQNFVLRVRHLSHVVVSHARTDRERKRERERNRERERERGCVRAYVVVQEVCHLPCHHAQLHCHRHKQHPKQHPKALNRPPSRVLERHGEAGVPGAGCARCVKAVRACRHVGRLWRALCALPLRGCVSCRLAACRAVWTPIFLLPCCVSRLMRKLSASLCCRTRAACGRLHAGRAPGGRSGLLVCMGARDGLVPLAPRALSAYTATPGPAIGAADRGDGGSRDDQASRGNEEPV